MTKKRIYPLKRRSKKLNLSRGGGWGFYTDYSRCTVGAGDTSSPMAQGLDGGSSAAPIADAGSGSGAGMGESVEITKVISPEEKFTHDFGCAMLELTPAAKSIVSYWVRKNIPFDSLYIDVEDGHEGYEEDFHTTLKYGIHTTNPEDIAKVIDGFGPVKITCGNVEKFDNEKFDVIKISVSGAALKELNAEISKKLECTDTFPEYIPHITLGYVKKGSCDNLLENDFFNLLTDTIDEIWFTSKDGEEYYLSLEIE